MLSEDYFGFRASPKLAHKYISRRTQLSAEKVSSSKSREKLKYDDMQLEKLRKKYVQPKSNKIDKERVQGERMNEKHNNLHMKDLKFKYFHYSDYGENGRKKQIRKRVEKRALQAIQRNLTPQSQLSQPKGIVNGKYSRHLQQNLSSRKASRQKLGKVQNQRYMKSSSKILLDTEQLKSSSLSHRTYRKINEEEKIIKNDSNGIIDDYNIKPKSKPNSILTPDSQLILGTQTIRKKNKIPIQEEIQTLELKKQDMLQISLNSRYGESQSIPIQNSVHSQNLSKEPQALVMSDYELIKQMQEKAKMEYLQNNNKQIQFNQISPPRSSFENIPDYYSNRNPSNENYISKVINDQSHISKKDPFIKLATHKIYREERYEVLKNSALSATPQQNTLEFILNSEMISNPSNYKNVIDRSPQFKNETNKTSQHNIYENYSSSTSSLNLSKSSNKNAANSFLVMNNPNLRMSNGIFNQSKIQNYPIYHQNYDDNQCPIPPKIFQKPSHQNMLFSSFNLLEQLKQMSNIEDRKMVQLYSAYRDHDEDVEILMDKIYEHFTCLNKLIDFVEETENFYVDNQQKQLFHQCSFMLLKKCLEERQKAIYCIKEGLSCFRLTGKQISEKQIQKYNYTSIMKSFCEQIEQGNKKLENTLEKFYNQLRSQGLLSIILNRKELSKQNLYYVMEKLNQQLELLINKIDENQEENIYQKDNEYSVISLRCFTIMELAFLLSELEGRKIKRMETSIQPEEFQLYCKANYGLFKQTVLYFH